MENLVKRIGSYLGANKVRRTMARVLALVVVFATTYSLVLPAITMTRDLEGELDGVRVSIEADTSALPIGTSLVLRQVLLPDEMAEETEDDAEQPRQLAPEEVELILEAALNGDESLRAEILRVLDISLEFNGNEIEPLGSVRLNLKSDLIGEANRPVLVHLSDNGEAELVAVLEQDGSELRLSLGTDPEPDEPAAPVEPDESEAPEEPAETEAPEEPAESETPVEPVETETPEEPAESEAPEEPAETVAPEEPAEAETPEEPAEAEPEPEHSDSLSGVVDEFSVYAIVDLLPVDRAPEVEPESDVETVEFTASVDGMDVTVTAPAEAFPEGTRMEVTPVEMDEETIEAVSQAVLDEAIENEDIELPETVETVEDLKAEISVDPQRVVYTLGTEDGPSSEDVEAVEAGEAADEIEVNILQAVNIAFYDEDDNVVECNDTVSVTMTTLENLETFNVKLVQIGETESSVVSTAEFGSNQVSFDTETLSVNNGEGSNYGIVVYDKNQGSGNEGNWNNQGGSSTKQYNWNVATLEPKTPGELNGGYTMSDATGTVNTTDHVTVEVSTDKTNWTEISAATASGVDTHTEQYIRITPKTGYYVKYLVVACNDGNFGHNCKSVGNGSGYTAGFDMDEGSIILDTNQTASGQNESNFYHRTSYPHHILIMLAKLPNPTAVQYVSGVAGGKVVTKEMLGTDIVVTAPASEWGDDRWIIAPTATSTTGSVVTGQYEYDETKNETAPSHTVLYPAQDVVKVGNTYYKFKEWKAECFDDVHFTTPVEGSGNYAVGETFTARVCVRLTAQWEPVTSGLIIYKNVRIDGAGDVSVFNGSTFNFEVRDSNNNLVKTVPVTVLNGAGSAYVDLDAGTSNSNAKKYTVNEVTAETVDDYKLTGTTYNPETQEVSIYNNHLAEITVTNTYKPIPKIFDFQIHKVGSNDGQELNLNGAQFTLLAQDGNSYGIDMTDNAAFLVRDISAGTYTLTETKSPDGYLSAGSVTVTITADRDDPAGYTLSISNGSSNWRVDEELVTITKDDGTTAQVYQITVVNHPGSRLPETGGIGTTVYTLGGLSLMGAAYLGLLEMSKQRKRARA